MSSRTQPAERLVAAIRQLYCERRRRHAMLCGHDVNWGVKPIPRYDGGETADGRRYKAVWPKLAAFFLDNSIDPEEYLRVQFERAPPNQPPAPDHLLTADSLRAFQLHSPRLATDELRFSLSSQKRNATTELFQRRVRLLSGWTQQGILRDLIGDLGLQFTPLFRCALAVSSGFQDLAAQWREPALWEYLNDPRGYDEAWGANLPPGLVEEARQMRTGLAELHQHQGESHDG